MSTLEDLACRVSRIERILIGLQHVQADQKAADLHRELLREHEVYPYCRLQSSDQDEPEKAMS